MELNLANDEHARFKQDSGMADQHIAEKLYQDSLKHFRTQIPDDRPLGRIEHAEKLLSRSIKLNPNGQKFFNQLILIKCIQCNFSAAYELSLHITTENRQIQLYSQCAKKFRHYSYNLTERPTEEELSEIISYLSTQYKGELLAGMILEYHALVPIALYKQ